MNHPLRVFLFATIVIIAVAQLTACSSVKSFFGSPDAAPVIAGAVDVAIATAEQKGVTAAQINRVCKVALVADSGTTATLAAVSGAVNAQIAKLGLPAADQAAAEVLEIAFSAAITAKIGNNASVASAQAEVAQVLNAAIQATGG